MVKTLLLCGRYVSGDGGSGVLVHTTQLESLGEALLDFEAIADLQGWLEQTR